MQKLLPLVYVIQATFRNINVGLSAAFYSILPKQRPISKLKTPKMALPAQ